MRRPRLRLAIVFLSVWVSPIVADEPDVPNFVLFPVTTALQRTLTSSELDAYCVVNASRINQDGIFDAEKFNPSAFEKEIKALSSPGAREIQIYLRFENGQTHQAADDQLMDAVKQLCREAGFERFRTGQQYSGSGWEQEVKTLADEAGDPSAVEPVVAQNLVRVSPVRTRFSRFLTGGADCFVDVRRPIDGRSGFPLETRRAVADLLRTLEFPGHRRLQLRVTSTTAGRPIVEKLIEGSDGGPPGSQLAREFGFESSSVVHVPTNGAPETLVGDAAPDFTLESLAGDEIRLSDAIRDRVAVVTFWGVACGPCRVEAPHLSAFYTKYKDSDFTVIAVNSYDESREKVAAYVDKAQLVHPIVLMGSETAKRYAVGAHPTTFWVDRSGTIVDYAIGFDAGDESQMAISIEQLLEADGTPSP